MESSPMGSTFELPKSIKILKLVVGFRAQTNTVLVRPLPAGDAKSTVFFFPGDVQDFHDQMRDSSENRGWIQYCYENVLEDNLPRKFPDSDIIVVAPKEKVGSQSSAKYINFCDCDNFGEVTLSRSGKALAHLHHLAESVCERAGLQNDLPLKLVGFSRGCVVITQLISELAQTDPAYVSTLRRIRELHLLDSGNGRISGAFPLDPQCLRKLADLTRSCACVGKEYGLRVNLYGSPYMLRSTTRPWIVNEKNSFLNSVENFQFETTKCQKCGETKQSEPIRSVFLFEQGHPNLTNHFRVLDEFEPC
eukprot:81060_1